jgi:arginase
LTGLAVNATKNASRHGLRINIMDIRLLLVPYDSGQRSVRMGAGPDYLQTAGLAEELEKQGHKVTSHVIEAATINWRAEVQTSFELMRSVAAQVREARAEEEFPLVLSGNCLSAVGVIAGLGINTGVFWIDAHGDFNTPQTTMSGFLDGMTLATATGRCWWELARSIEGFVPVPDEAVLMLGVRDLDPAEATALAKSGIVRLGAEISPNELAPRLDALGQQLGQFYLHLDLDALDPSEGRANGYTAKGGFSKEKLQELLRLIAGRLPVAAMTLSSYDPAYDPENKICKIAIDAAKTVVSGQL